MLDKLEKDGKISLPPINNKQRLKSSVQGQTGIDLKSYFIRRKREGEKIIVDNSRM